MVYIRGHAYDYDRWEKEGAEGWSYADCLPYFRKSQTHELGKLTKVHNSIIRNRYPFYSLATKRELLCTCQCQIPML